MIEAEIHITGRIQGVGFRPFIWRKAVENKLRGYVINLGDAGVEVVVEGPRERIEAFTEAVRSEVPSVAEIDDIEVSFWPYLGRFEDFTIDRSRESKESVKGIFPPDIGICPECIQDMRNSESRWHLYPFTACAWCGPRFTAIKTIPYDRERTHMAQFLMCDHCGKEYLDPMDRRFDAQGITCSQCGPKMTLYDGFGNEIASSDIFVEASRILEEGKILAVKGIGGVHLAAQATDSDVVAELRRRKMRPSQPFALMAPDLDTIDKFASMIEAEKRVLSSWRRPIVLLRKKPGGQISELVAPGLDRVGVMIPYTGIHLMLFKHLDEPALIMTSGNKPGL
ncbi:MAG: carbamoyltransferase HypF, partial [Candidatus Bathyarchaeota archaeon]